MKTKYYNANSLIEVESDNRTSVMSSILFLFLKALCQ